MTATALPNSDELHAVVDDRLTALVRELQDANWRVEDIADAMNAVLNRKWLRQAQALREARAAVPDNFVSDGNEG